ncbi:hypothetical protein J6TS2_09280 [Heyndrickxia sporothermodurans]|nr:hypothetical protein J6TS2_09280 [Heyndrickxia sporothermodurans]
MDYINRETLLDQMNAQLKDMMERYQLEDIGIYEEEGMGKDYYIGYTIRKNGKIYMLSMPYEKNGLGKLSLKNKEWTIQGEEGEAKVFHSLEDVFLKIDH